MHVYNGYNNLISYIISLPITVIRQVNNITRIKLSFVLKIKKTESCVMLLCMIIYQPLQCHVPQEFVF